MDGVETLSTVQSALGITVLGGRIGAELHDVQLSGDLPAAVVRQIRDAVLKYKVVFLRDQKGSSGDFENFSDLYGKPLAHPISAPPAGNAYTFEMDYSTEFRSDVWHTDFSFQPDFVDSGILYPSVAAEFGGETAWANTVAAYEEMPRPLRIMLDELWAVHTADIPFAMKYPYPTPAELEMARNYRNKIGRSTRHPVVRVIPETGERAILAGGFVQYFEGFVRETSSNIASIIQHYVTRPENTIRWRWRLGDVAIWDNRSTQHYGVRDYGKTPRVMRRISLGRSVPVAIDGSQSTLLSE